MTLSGQGGTVSVAAGLLTSDPVSSQRDHPRMCPSCHAGSEMDMFDLGGVYFSRIYNLVCSAGWVKLQDSLVLSQKSGNSNYHPNNCILVFMKIFII